jgi:ABC-2 type transport system ATP-binding protein
MAEAALILDNISKSFGSLCAVSGLSATVPTGTICGLLGPNGAGKTTTLRMILDILRPDSGRLSVLGHPTAAEVRHRIGYMPEERGLYRKMTVLGVLEYFAIVKGLDRSQATAAARRWLERVGLADRGRQKVEELSRGLHQKLQFAVTVVNDPEVVILDEPFSGLDPVSHDHMKGIVLDMRREGRTVLFSTHIMHEAEQMCDRLLLVSRGRVVANGTLDELRARWPTDGVTVELDGDAAFVAALPMVARVTPDGRSLDVTLRDGADPQELLRALVDRVRVRRFQIKVPSLHEIFVRLVEDADA